MSHASSARSARCASAIVLLFAIVLLGSASSAIAARSAAEFYAPRALSPMECGMYLEDVHCQSERRGAHFLAQVAELKPDGSVTFCSSHSLRRLRCNLGNAGERSPTLHYGAGRTIGPFRCAIQRIGVTCKVLASGKGFLLTESRMVAVGGAVAHPAPLHLGSFLSPDRKVWCGLDAERAFCGIGLAGLHQTFPAGLAQLDADGKLSLCFYARESEAPLFHGFPQGCLQNWDQKAPVLSYGQSTEVGGLSCVSGVDGITCQVLAGAARGKGFRVGASEAVELSSPAAPASAD